ncbi:MAG: (Fe-S)-binding protein [Terriglobales bacterium]
MGRIAQRHRHDEGDKARSRCERHSEPPEVPALSAHAPIEAPVKSNFTTSDKPTWELYSTCIHCGLCLQQCPTYRVLGMEADSPRGRIYQILQVDEGRLPIQNPFVEHIDRCLGCLGCQTACPSGVDYGHIVERARAEIQANYPRPFFERKLRDFFYGTLLRDNRRLSSVAKLLRFYQHSGLQTLVRKSGVLKLLGLEKVEALSPRMDKHFSFEDFGKEFPAEGSQRGRVALLAGCIASVSFDDLNQATIRVLNKNGVSVVLPAKQGCCGALHAHAGRLEEARAQARQNIDAMLDDSIDAIVTNAAGCGGTLKEYHELLKDDPEYGKKAKQFVAKMRDINEYLDQVGLIAPLKPLQKRVTYQDPCHLAHAQKIRSAPRQLLKALGAELVEMPNSDLCCGSAGVYNVVQNSLSMKILAAKMDDVSSVESEIIATANVGCMLQLRAGVEQRGLKRRVAHVVELLNEAYE